MFFGALLCLLLNASTVNATDVAFFDGKAYSQINVVQRCFSRSMVEIIKRNPHQSILDIGCGTGEITAELAQTFTHASVHGIDPSESMLAWGRQNFSAFPNLQFIHGLAPHYFQDCSPNAYSTIVSFFALHWLSYINMKKTLQDVHHILPHGGGCYFVLAGRRADKQIDPLTQAVNAAIKNEGWVNYFNRDDVRGLEDTICMLTEDEFKSIAVEAGFGKPQVMLKKVEYVFESTQKFKEWLNGVSPYKKIVGNRHDLFLDTVVQEYTRIYPVGLDGSLTYVDYMLEVILKKN